MNTLMSLTRVLGLAIALIAIFACRHEASAKSLNDVAAIKIEKLSEHVQSVIEDRERADRIVSLIAELEEIFVEFQAEFSEHQKAMRRIFKDFRSSRGDYQRLLDTFNKKRIARNERILQIASKLRDETSPEEWKDLNKKIKRAANSLLELAKLP